MENQPDPVALYKLVSQLAAFRDTEYYLRRSAIWLQRVREYRHMGLRVDARVALFHAKDCRARALALIQ